MKTIPIKLSALKEIAKTRPEGYEQECISKGHVQGDVLFLTSETYYELLKKYNPSAISTTKPVRQTGKCCSGNKPTQPKVKSVVTASNPPVFPPVRKQLRNFASSMGKAAMRVLANETVKVDKETVNKRLEICSTCEFFNKEKDRCSVCGCFTKFKTMLATEHCPKGFW